MLFTSQPLDVPGPAALLAPRPQYCSPGLTQMALPPEAGGLAQPFFGARCVLQTGLRPPDAQGQPGFGKTKLHPFLSHLVSASSCDVLSLGVLLSPGGVPGLFSVQSDLSACGDPGSPRFSLHTPAMAQALLLPPGLLQQYPPAGLCLPDGALPLAHAPHPPQADLPELLVCSLYYACHLPRAPCDLGAWRRKPMPVPISTLRQN